MTTSTRSLRASVPGALALALVFVLLQGCAAGDPALAGAERELRQGDYQRALELTDQALEVEPTNAQAHLVRAEAYRGLSRQAAADADRERYAENARASYTRVRELGADEGRVLFGLLTAYGEAMNYAGQAFQQGAEDPQAYRRAAYSFAVASAIMPDSAQAYLGHGIALLGAGETTAAAPPLRRAVDLGTQVPEAYLYLGRIYLAEDRANDAITVLEQGRERFPDNPEIESELLNVYVHTGQTDRARAAYADAVVTSPQDPLLRYNYGTVLLQMRQYDEASTQLRRAVELDPDYASAYFNLGAVYINQAAAVEERLADLDVDDAQYATVRAERDEFYRQAVEPLERARTLLTAQGEDVRSVCETLFRAYAQLRMNQEARAAAACAGIELD
jgi:tetratricopeptide (TPR) repeat protein